MNLKAIGERIRAAFRWPRAEAPAAIVPARTMRLTRALPPPDECGLLTEQCVMGQSLDEQALDDAYWVLLCGIGCSLDDRFQHYREHLLRRRTDSAEIDRRFAAIRPFLTTLLEGDDEGADRERSRISRVRIAPRHYAPGFGIRFSTGEVQMLTSPGLTKEQADGQLGGGAMLVWRDAWGRVSAVSVPIQEYEDDEAAGEEGAL